MAQFFQVHPQNPQGRLIRQSVTILRQGGIIAYPTDSSYALGCAIGNKDAMDRIRSIRRVEDDHNFTLVCRDLSEVSLYTRGRQRDLPAAQALYSRALYLYPPGHPGSAPSPAASQASYNRPQDPGLSNRDGAFGET